VHNPLHTNFNTGLVLLFNGEEIKTQSSGREREKETLCRKTTIFLSVQTIDNKIRCTQWIFVVLLLFENNILSLAIRSWLPLISRERERERRIKTND